MNKNTVRAEVEAFREKTAHGRKVDDCFPAWFLSHTYGLSPTQSVLQSSDPSETGGPKGYDFGLDAFHVDLTDSNQPKLILIQAKYSDSLSYASKGFRDLAKLLPKLAWVLGNVGSDSPQENRILVNFRKTINLLSADHKAALTLEFIVIYLCDHDQMIIHSNTRKAREDLREAIQEYFPDRTFTVGEYGPARMSDDSTVRPPPPLRMDTLAAQRRIP